MSATLHHPASEAFTVVRTRDDAEALITRALSNQNETPIVIVSPWNDNGVSRFGVPLEEIATLVGPRAAVYGLADMGVSWYLEDTPGLRTYGGAIRVVGPHSWGRIIRTDSGTAEARRRVTAAVEHAERLFEERTPPRRASTVLRVITSAPTVTATPGDVAARLQGAARPASANSPASPGDTRSESIRLAVAEDPVAPAAGSSAADDPLAQPLEQLSDVLAQAQAALANVMNTAAESRAPSRSTEVEHPAGGDTAELETLRRQLETARDEASRLRANAAAARTRQATAESEADAAARAAAAAEASQRTMSAELVRLREQVDELRTKKNTLEAQLAAESAPLFSDPEEQFRDDVHRTWLRVTAESERSQFPLRDFVIGASFIESLALPQAPREKVIEVVVDVLTRRAFNMPSRAVHAHGNGRSAGTTGQMTRDDSASAYRCYIRSHTPQAPRLLWWELTNGTVELALAARHDDPMP
ncbi:Uncharacterised protein (plasmid) [Tsukamurella tyrosinosolvens]|uniref:Uncharacterized protein n=2 Tax=Tsukamurella tyrosinosolvens TaxID=57704 RepID=A0A1H4UCP1_TSUTY|nr:hypothetical protein SAMN04489793_2856 [Tsukamurella tyrosinosolvens]VEH94134.1 Uncharacterised protein [Tsukamurella tyrosinosolvens]